MIINIGRSTIYGNPIIIGRRCQFCGMIHNKAGDTLKCFRQYAENRIKNDLEYANAIRQLEGKKLYCPGCRKTSKTCHGRVLEELSRNSLI